MLSIRQWLSPCSLLFASFCCSSLLLLRTESHAKTVIPFKHNMNTVWKEWSCQSPKPRLVYLEDEYDDYLSNAVYFPHAAVVSRCGKSVGCCKVGQTCSPVEMEDLTFLIDEFVDGKKHRKAVTLKNHLKCECQSSLDDPLRR